MSNSEADSADREAMFCHGCHSTWRVRAAALGVLVGVGAQLRPLTELAADWSWLGLGISDHVALAGALGTRFNYTNTYYHRCPRLDLLDVPQDRHHEVGFIVCSDVLEHVPPPASRALEGLRTMMRPGGFCVLSVPSAPTGDTREFYPDLTSWEVVGETVRWIDSTGTAHVDEHPEFHGGPGQTLAFRLWSAPDFTTQLMTAGFSSVTPLPDAPELGVPSIPFAGVYLAFAS